MKSTHVRDLPAHDRMIRARTLLTQSHPFYASMAIHMELREDPSIPTMEVDGKHLFYNPQFVMEQSEPELIGVVVHEIKHITLNHHTRRGSRDLDDWNRACDYAINPGIVAEGTTLPKGMLLDQVFADQGAEQIYAELKRRKQQPPPQDQDPDDDEDEDQGGGDQDDQTGGDQDDQGDDDRQGDDQDDGDQGQAGCDPGGCGGVRDAYLEDGQSLETAAAEIEAMVRQCAAVAKAGAGEMPDAIGRILDELNQARVNWREEFSRFIDSAVQSQPTWNRLDRRMLALGYAFPGRTPDAVEEGVVFVDTSASIPQDGATAFAGEVQGMLDTGRVTRIHVVSVDDAVRNVQTFELGDTVEILELKGGGGTRFDVGFDWMSHNAPDAAFAVYLTDLDVYDSHWGQPPACPVLWTAYGPKRTAPFGEVIPLDPYQ